MVAREIDSLLTDVDVAGIYGIDRSSVWRWVEKNLIPKPVVQRHKFTRWSARDIHQAIEQLRQDERKEQAS